MGWTYAFSNLCEPGNYHGSYSTGVMSVKFQHHNFVEDEKWMKGCALKKWESTLNFVFMPMDPMWNLSWKLLAKYLIIWVILPVSLNWIPCNYGSDHIVLLWSHFSGKFKHLSSEDQYPTPTSTLICRQVLHSGILRISWNCITSYGFFINCFDSNFPGFWVVVNRTPNSESSPYSDSITLSNFRCLWV